MVSGLGPSILDLCLVIEALGFDQEPKIKDRRSKTNEPSQLSGIPNRLDRFQLPMKLLRHIIFAILLTTVAAFSVAAQNREDDKKKPPKENAEIKPQETKKPRGNENNNTNKPKKPQAFLLYIDPKQTIVT